MKITETSYILIGSLILVLVYLLIQGTFFPSLLSLKMVLPENTDYNWGELHKVYEFSAVNIFDKGYVREIGSEIFPRLSNYPGNTFLDKGTLYISQNSSEGIVKLSLPEGFKEGILNLQVTTKSKYSIGISYDLNDWKLYDYPGFTVRALASVSLNSGKSAKDVYLKFLPSKSEQLSVYFDVFQYTSIIIKNEKEFYGIIFYPDNDIGYGGENIIQQGFIYDTRKNKTAN